MTIKIGLLRADDVAPDLAKIYGEYPQMIKQLVLAANQARGAQAETLEFSTYAVNREQYPADINEVDAYIISGSKSSVYDPEPWIKKLLTLSRLYITVKRKPSVSVLATRSLPRHLAVKPKKPLPDGGWASSRRFSIAPPKRPA